LKVDAALTDFFSEIDERPEIKVGMSFEEFDKVKDTLETYLTGEDAKRYIELNVAPVVDKAKAEYARGYLETIAPDGTRSFEWVGTVNDSALDAAKKKIEEKVPAEKKMALEVELEKARLEATSKEIEAMFDYKAQVDVAEIEAAMERVKVAFESINTGISSTGDVISSSLSSLANFMGNDVNSTQARWLIEEQLAKENEWREQEFELQKGMFQLEKDRLEMQRKRMENGKDYIINLEVPGTVPVLIKQTLYEIVKEIQVMATDEGLETLLKLPN